MSELEAANEISGGLTFRNMMPLFLALLLIFIIPMILRRYGLDPEDLWRMLLTRVKKTDYNTIKKTKEPWQNNSRGNEIKGLVSTLLIFARRNQIGLVYPGTVTHKGKMANLVALAVTRGEVIGINCFGFGGSIREEKGKWTQHMNGADNPIPDPIAANRSQLAIVRSAMDAAGMKEVPLRVLAVFTSRTVQIKSAHPREVLDSDGLIRELTRSVSEGEDRFDPEALSRQLNALVERVRKGK